MRTPPFLMGAAIVFWGWRMGVWQWALVPAIILELSRVVSTRWDFNTADLRRIFDLSILLVAAEAIVLYSSSGRILNGEISFKFSQWLPLPLLPMMLAQAYGNVEKIPLGVLIFLRRYPDSELAKKSFNISYLYFAICLMAASATGAESPYFYPAIALLISFALLAVRPRRASAASLFVWFLLMGIVIGIGYVSHRGLRFAHSNLETAIGSWFNNLWNDRNDPNESHTAIGRIGRIRLSGKIILRVTPEQSSQPPGLLREASYCSYTNSVWHAADFEYSELAMGTNDVAFLLSSNKVPSVARIARYAKGGRSLLALPHGTFEIHELPFVVRKNRLGTVKVEEGPDLINMLAYYGWGKTIDGKPDDLDLEIPANEKPVLDQIVSDLQLRDKTEPQKIHAISQYFQSFTYSMTIPTNAVDVTGNKTAVGQFLTTTRTGHCEYFATATVLLLRAAGIPARYAIGYAVEESSRSGKTYLVRERHGHAWTLVYRAKRHCWEELDTTPASWNEIEDARVRSSSLAAVWEQISDAWSDIVFNFSKWRHSKSSYIAYLRWLLIPLIAVFLWRIFNRKRHQRNRGKTTLATQHVWPGLDSEFYRIEQRLTNTGIGRLPNELFDDWTRRAPLPNPELLKHIIELHRRLRFDPHSLNVTERQVLREEVETWLAQFSSTAQR